MRLWDLERGVELRKFAGHQGHVIAVAFARDGRTLLSADAGGVLRAWDGPTGHELGVFPLDTGALQAAAFTPGATAFVSPTSGRCCGSTGSTASTGACAWRAPNAARAAPAKGRG